jgi:hypothetical protein
MMAYNVVFILQQPDDHRRNDIILQPIQLRKACCNPGLQNLKLDLSHIDLDHKRISIGYKLRLRCRADFLLKFWRKFKSLEQLRLLVCEPTVLVGRGAFEEVGVAHDPNSSMASVRSKNLNEPNLSQAMSFKYEIRNNHSHIIEQSGL